MDFEWTRYKLNSNVNKLVKRVTKKQIINYKSYNKKILSIDEGERYILKKIHDGTPFVAGRYGSVELDIIVAAIDYVKHNSKKDLDKKLELGYIFTNAGFFPKNKDFILKFAEDMLEYSKDMDLIGVWFNPMENYVINNYAHNSNLTYLRALEPWYSNIPWTSALKGKKVLVIHPFAETIEQQYAKRESLFENKNILPEFELKTLKAVQTIAGRKDERFITWFDALDYMYKEAMKIDFDIAIIGCGAYGFPLATKLKRAGKQAIHMGGATQILFGIKGNRWDNHSIISHLYNENWVRVLDSDKPKNANVIENACYW